MKELIAQLTINASNILTHAKYTTGDINKINAPDFTDIDTDADELRLHNIILLAKYTNCRTSSDISTLISKWINSTTDKTYIAILEYLLKVTLADLPYYNDYIVFLVKHDLVDEHKELLGVPLDTLHEVLFIY